MSVKEHKDTATRKQQTARCAVLTVSDSRSRETDTSGRAAVEILKKSGHTIAIHEIIPNNKKRVAANVVTALRDVDLVLTIGGTGVSHKDVSVDAVLPLMKKELPGFGELFRAFSVKDIGTATILSRACMGISEKGKVIVALPGSEGAVRLGLEGILMAELPHLLLELRRYA